MEDFDKFWEAYPRKIAKGDARKAWTQTQKIRPELDFILRAIEAQKETWENPKFIPYPATWLRAERWDDEVQVHSPKSKSMEAIIMLERMKHHGSH
jgi:hypothetical protein